uniref:ATP synthase F0 subunit 8 n=1 Tax=Bemisia tabaci TaxID=7038 RepID=A0A678P541_BEMTA|nr:ATP synthase F0 subunit 8 [Bemisia tabaci]
MSPLWWFYLMLMFWLGWLVSSVSTFYWFKLGVLMNPTFSSSFFFFFFFYFDYRGELSIGNLNNKFSLIDLSFFYYYDL